MHGHSFDENKCFTPNGANSLTVNVKDFPSFFAINVVRLAYEFMQKGANISYQIINFMWLLYMWVVLSFCEVESSKSGINLINPA